MENNDTYNYNKYQKLEKSKTRLKKLNYMKMQFKKRATLLS